jgi:hypothetical protein
MADVPVLIAMAQLHWNAAALHRLDAADVQHVDLTKAATPRPLRSTYKASLPWM